MNSIIISSMRKTNYLNYLETEHIIDIMLALHSDHQEQMRSIIDVTLTSEREATIAISQKNSVKAKDIQKKLHKLRVLYCWKQSTYAHTYEHTYAHMYISTISYFRFDRSDLTLEIFIHSLTSFFICMLYHICFIY